MLRPRNPFKTSTYEDPPLRVTWRRCGCHVWPIVLGYRVHRCGDCGEFPDLPVAAPDTDTEGNSR